MKVGVSSYVTLSVGEVPVSDVLIRSAASGVDGVLSSITILVAVDDTEVFPALSTCTADTVYDPATKAVVVNVQVPPEVAVVVNTEVDTPSAIDSTM